MRTHLFCLRRPGQGIPPLMQKLPSGVPLYIIALGQCWSLVCLGKAGLRSRYSRPGDGSMMMSQYPGSCRDCCRMSIFAKSRSCRHRLSGILLPDEGAYIGSRCLLFLSSAFILNGPFSTSKCCDAVVNPFPARFVTNNDDRWFLYVHLSPCSRWAFAEERIVSSARLRKLITMRNSS